MDGRKIIKRNTNHWSGLYCGSVITTIVESLFAFSDLITIDNEVDKSQNFSVNGPVKSLMSILASKSYDKHWQLVAYPNI